MSRTKKGNRKLSASRKRRIAGRLAAYSVAAGAVVVAGEQAPGRVVYTDVSPDATITSPGLNIDLNADSVMDFHLDTSFNSRSTHFPPYSWVRQSSSRLVSASGLGSNQVAYGGAGLWGPLAAALSSQNSINNNLSFRGSGMLATRWRYAFRLSSWTLTYGYFPGAGDKFLGLKFMINNQFHYGWARMNVQGGAALTTKLKDYAYESQPGVGISAGAVPEPGTLGMLALGATGLLAWRTLRKRRDDQRDAA